ncbi:MAG: dihydroorotase [Alphaproteobacteria bacterium]|nr:dihydroorotase [Alphaproteobacteria bacterium]
MTDVLFTDVRVLDPGADLDLPHAELLVRDGRIADLGSGLGRPDGAAIVAGAGAVLCPGLVDMRATLGEPGGEHRETVASAAAAASFGGVTTVAALPDGVPAIDDPALVRLLRARGEETGAITVVPYGAATRGCRGEELCEYGLLREAGAAGFTDGARAIGPARLMRLALTYARGFGARIIQHPEEPTLAAGGAATQGELATRLGLPTIPAAAEALMVARDIRLVELTGGAVHFAHVSTAEALALIRAAKARGLAVTCDTAPPYFDLNETAIGDWRTFAKLSPPLRGEADRQGVAAALGDGTIDAIASDHRPCDADDKRLPFAEAAAGGTGLATLLAVTLAQVHGAGLPLPRAIELLTAAPARLLGIEAGTLRKGAPADLCLFSPERAWQVAAGALPGRAPNTPFDGRALEGRVVGTWKAGWRVFGG